MRDYRHIFNKVIPYHTDDSMSLYEFVGRLYEYLKDFEGSLDEAHEKIDDMTEQMLTEWKDKYPQVGGVIGASLQKKAIRGYSYSDMLEDIDRLVDAFPETKRVVYGKSVFGRDLISLQVGNPNSNKHLFIVDGLHGGESSASITLAMAEVLLRNDRYLGFDVKHILTNTCAHFMLMCNPDIEELGRFGFDSIPERFKQYEDSFKTEVEKFVRNRLKREGVGSSFSTEEFEELGEYIRSLGGNPEESFEAYEFREQDLILWRANANGVDLHYNYFTEKMRTDLYRWQTGQGVDDLYKSAKGSPGRDPYTDENKYIKEYIESYNGYRYAICNHQKGPVLFWRYGQTGYNMQRCNKIGNELCTVMGVPTDDYRNSTPLGFTGWFYQMFPGSLTFAVTNEMGYGYREQDVNGYNMTDVANVPRDRSPVPDEQYDSVYQNAHKLAIHMMARFVARNDLWERDGYLDVLSIRNDLTDHDTRYAVPSIPLVAEIARQAGFVYKTVVDIGLTTEAELEEIVEKLGDVGRLKTLVASNFKLTDSFPSWFMSKIGTLDVQAFKTMVVVSFRPWKSSLEYVKVFDKTNEGYETDWNNTTAITTDYKQFGIKPLENFNEAFSKVPPYHELRFTYNETDMTWSNLPDFVKNNAAITVRSDRANCWVTIRNVVPHEIWEATYSRTTKVFSTWRKRVWE